MSVWTRVSWNRVTLCAVTKQSRANTSLCLVLADIFEAERHPPRLPAQDAIVVAFTNLENHASQASSR